MSKQFKLEQNTQPDDNYGTFLFPQFDENQIVNQQFQINSYTENNKQ